MWSGKDRRLCYVRIIWIGRSVDSATFVKMWISTTVDSATFVRCGLVGSYTLCYVRKMSVAGMLTK